MAEDGRRMLGAWQLQADDAQQRPDATRACCFAAGAVGPAHDDFDFRAICGGDSDRGPPCVHHLALGAAASQLCPMSDELLRPRATGSNGI